MQSDWLAKRRLPIGWQISERLQVAEKVQQLPTVSLVTAVPAAFTSGLKYTIASGRLRIHFRVTAK